MVKEGTILKWCRYRVKRELALKPYTFYRLPFTFLPRVSGILFVVSGKWLGRVSPDRGCDAHPNGWLPALSFR